MGFTKDKPIYLQIVNILCDQILEGHFKGGRIPSVRDMALRMQVNPNTIMRTYTELEHHEIIRMQRGLGYFLMDDALPKIKEQRRREFIEKILPDVFCRMKQLEMDFEELKKYYNKENS